MVAWPLVEPSISEGSRLIEGLELHDFPIRAALWRFMPEANRWRLFLASPVYDEFGPLESIHRLHKVLSESPEPYGVSLDDTWVISPNDPLIKGLKQRFKAHPERAAGSRPGGTMVGDVYVEESYNYKLT